MPAVNEDSIVLHLQPFLQLYVSKDLAVQLSAFITGSERNINNI